LKKESRPSLSARIIAVAAKVDFALEWWAKKVVYWLPLHHFQQKQLPHATFFSVHFYATKCFYS
jgi:hypothetical protein